MNELKVRTGTPLLVSMNERQAERIRELASRFLARRNEFIAAAKAHEDVAKELREAMIEAHWPMVTIDDQSLLLRDGGIWVQDTVQL